MYSLLTVYRSRNKEERQNDFNGEELGHFNKLMLKVSHKTDTTRVYIFIPAIILIINMMMLCIMQHDTDLC